MSQYNKLTEVEIKLWKQALDLGLEKLIKEGWEVRNNSRKFDVLYKGHRIPPKEIIAFVFDYFDANDIKTSIFSVSGGDRDTNELLRDFGLEVIEKKMSLGDLLEKIDVWYTWRDNYKKYVPNFIEEAKRGLNYSEWDSDIFIEFFEKSNGQCVSSLKQGYFTLDEKELIKRNWREVAPLLQAIANSEDTPSFEMYNKLKQTIRQYTKQDRRAATNRLIASIQPYFLCTIVNQDNLNTLIFYLNKFVLNADIKIKSNWFENSHEVHNFFLKEGGFKDVYEMITYPWQLFEYFNGKHHLNDNDMSEQQNNNEIIDLLKYKKQIILQGPPGTGKTREAKLLAKQFLYIDEFDKTDMSLIRLGEYFKTKTDKTPFIIKGISESQNYFKVKSDKATHEYTVNFKQVIDCINSKGWNDPTDDWNSHGNSSYLQVLAKIIYDRKVEKLESDQIKLIQFHPSYTYEDFVRGIVSKPNKEGEGIIYEAENKTLGNFAKKALENFIDSSKDVNEINKDLLLKQYFNDFVDNLQEIINNKGFVELTDSYRIIDTEEDAFRYLSKRKEDTYLGNRMLFKDILKAYVDGNLERQDIKHNDNLSGLAKHHSSYYVRVVNMFQSYLKDNNLGFDKAVGDKVSLKNYVLIIDEINRANLSSVLGELIYALEYRGESVESMYAVDGENELILPPNLYIIGTMNTADRSVGHIDYAIRRRFSFVNVLPKDLSGEKDVDFDKVLFEKVAELFETYLSSEFEKKDVQLGHSYFIDKSEEGGSMDIRLEYEIKPILFEYIKDGVLIGDSIKNLIKDLKPSI